MDEIDKLRDEIAGLRREIAELRLKIDALQPVLEAFISGKLFFKLLVWMGGVSGVVSVSWIAFGHWFSEHFK